MRMARLTFVVARSSHPLRTRAGCRLGSQAGCNRVLLEVLDILHIAVVGLQSLDVIYLGRVNATGLKGGSWKVKLTSLVDM